MVNLAVDGHAVRFDWGRSHELGTAAYWIDQTLQREPVRTHRLGTTLAEEVTACLLGGFGLPAAVGLAAFRAVRDSGMILTDAPPQPDAIEAVLRRPLTVPGRPRPVRYRFPRQRSQRIAAALAYVRDLDPPEDGPRLREALLGCSGIGPKTASWIARNWLGCDCVAIVDIHVHRAGVGAGFFSTGWRLPSDYSLFERAFRAVAALGGVSTAALDACIWDQLQYLGRGAHLLIGPAANPLRPSDATGRLQS